MSMNLKLLLISMMPPWPPVNGGYQRTNLLYRALSKCGSVDIALISSPGFVPHEYVEYAKQNFSLVGSIQWPHLSSRWPVPMRLFPRSMKDRIRPLIERNRLKYQVYPPAQSWIKKHLAEHNYDVVIGRYLLPVCKVGAFKQAPLIVDVDDIDFRIHETLSETPGLLRIERFLLNISRQQIKDIVRDKLKYCDHLWLTSEKDTAQISLPNTTVLPNIPFVVENTSLAPDCPPQSNNMIILVVADLGYGPNRYGVIRFLNEVWPKVVRTVPGVALRIVGKIHPKDKRAWSRINRVEPLGFVEDLRRVYDESAFTVAPVFFGGGTKIKVVESLAYGRTCVVTPHAHYGYENTLRHGESVLRAESPSEMARTCIQLLREPKLTKSLAEHGYQIVRNHYSFELFEQVVSNTIEQVMNKANA